MTSFLRKYYKGPHWKAKSEETQRLAGYQCQVVEDVTRCKRPSQQAHHTNYACLYHEVAGEDTIAVCGWHHMLLHGIVARPDNDNQHVLWDWFDGKAKKAA